MGDTNFYGTPVRRAAWPQLALQSCAPGAHGGWIFIHHQAQKEMATAKNDQGLSMSS